MRIRAVTALVAAGLVISACSGANQATFGPTDEASPERGAELNRQLREMPSLEETLEEYRELRETLVQEIEVSAPGVRFVSTMDPADHYPDDRGSCSGEWLETDGMTVHLDRRTSAVPLSEEAWPEAVALVRAAARDIGIDHESLVKNTPGDREIRFTNAENASLKLSTWKAALLSIQTPCRLPAGPAVPVVPGSATGDAPTGEG